MGTDNNQQLLRTDMAWHQHDPSHGFIPVREDVALRAQAACPESPCGSTAGLGFLAPESVVLAPKPRCCSVSNPELSFHLETTNKAPDQESRYVFDAGPGRGVRRSEGGRTRRKGSSGIHMGSGSPPTPGGGRRRAGRGRWAGSKENGKRHSPSQS